MIIVNGGVATPSGFFACGVKSGIKVSGRTDLGLVYSEKPAVAAAAFTTNTFKASPVRVSLKHISNKNHQAIIVNSGNANCANGRIGDRDSEVMATLAAKALGLAGNEVLVASTGIIGRKLPIEKIKKAMPGLMAMISRSGGADFARAIMTTDTKPKEFAVKVKIGGSTVAIGGACKGVGMIYPQMKTGRHATMLCFITTDASITKRALEAALNESIDDSFNMVSVDGDMSTNDTCFVMANGYAANRKIEVKGGDFRSFVAALKYITAQLAMMLARDGEGATKFVEIEVRGAKSLADARAAARKISTSSLLKCCIFGEDPNWGRVAAACGASTAVFDPEKVDIYLGGVKALSNGLIAKSYSKEVARKQFRKSDIKITVDLHAGAKSATAWTCDFSKEYVAINSEYST